MSEPDRLVTLQSFREGDSKVLVATDGLRTTCIVSNVRDAENSTFFTGGKRDRALAGELAHVFREGWFNDEADGLGKFPQTIKKKTHARTVYGAFFRDDVDMSAAPTGITFDD
ncbi:hypothetical protein PENSPDRAFT_689944 [Peniophora sp. CONT]|nr:hypothetical protein PENSPDRAFT_689944 [Peniophora sp. CONT]